MACKTQSGPILATRKPTLVVGQCKQEKHETTADDESG
jgi:hypothetical protein